MVKTSVCLKRSFQVFNVIFGIIGGIIFALALFMHGAYHTAEEGDNMLPGIVFIYILGGVMIGLSLFGTYCSWKEKKWALILYCIGTALLCIALLTIGGRGLITKNKAHENLLEHFKNMKPLEKADAQEKMNLEMFQNALDCCGVDEGYQDWGEHLPDSCLCPGHYKYSYKCIEVHNRTANASEEVIYSQPCLPLLVDFVGKAVSFILGLCFGLSLFVMVGLVLSIALLYQMIRWRSAPVTFSVNTNELEYKELCETAESI